MNMLAKPTLIVHTTYFPVGGAGAPAADPERGNAVRLGEDLYGLLTRSKVDPLEWGAGIPVRIATAWERVDTSEAEVVLIIPVLGFAAFQNEPARIAALSAMQSWKTSSNPARVVPVLASKQWRNLENKMPTPLLTELYAPNDKRRATLNEILHVVARLLANQEAYASQLFISHAKADMEATENAAEKIRAYVTGQTTGNAFFDRVSVLPGEDIAAQLDREASQGVFIAVRGDRYASRAWCRRELLRAKQRRLPTLTVEVLAAGEARSAAYSGNGPSVVWARNEPHQEASVVTRAMVEAVRHLHFLREAERVIEAAALPPTTLALSRPPELLDLVALRERTDAALVLLHPDPVLPAFEHAVLQDANKRVRAVTPTTAFSNVIGSSIRAPLDGWKVALSVSDSPDAPDGGGRDGATSQHVHDAITFLARGLVGVGASIAHGGDFRRNGYTVLLSQIVVAYNETSRRSADVLHTYASVPVDLNDGADLTCTLHAMWGHPQAKLLPAPSGGPALPEPFYHSDMRRVMALETQARVVIAGAAEPRPEEQGAGYSGRYPGVVEEAWRTLERNQPLYVAGGFGGGAALVVEALTNPSTPELLNEAKWSSNAAFGALVAKLDGHACVEALELPKTQMDMATAIHRLGRRHLESDETSLAWNGLTLAENQRLFATRDPLTLTALILKGLIAKSTDSAQRKLRVELVEGDVTSATNLELLVFPTFSDVPLSGAGQVLDRVSAGSAKRAHRARTPVPAGSPLLGADYLYAADLSDVNSSLQDVPAHARRAAREVAETVRKHGFKRVGIVAFFGNVAESLSTVIPAMVDGLCIGDDVEVVWFERDPMRAALIASLLRGCADVALTRREGPVPPAQQASPGKRRTMLTIRQAQQELDVALLIHHANGLSPVVRTPFDETQRKDIAGGPHDGAPLPDELSRRGDLIARLLFGGNPGKLLDAIGNSELVITHDEEAAGIPYEALSWTKDGDTTKPAMRGGVVRHLLAPHVAPERGLTRPPRAGQLGVLVVIDPTGDLPGASAEGEALVRRLNELGGFRLCVLRRKEATMDEVCARIADPALDVLHYCGHAFFDDTGPELRSGLNCADGDLTLERIQEKVHSVPRLAFFNACEAGRVRGEAVKVGEPQAFASFFLQAGVDAYLGTFWRVADGGAGQFAAEVYQALGEGCELGEAVVRGRKLLEADGTSDWANYVLYGDVGFRLVQTGALPAGASTDQALELPAPSFRMDGTTVVASWVFASKDAPPDFAVMALAGDTSDPFLLQRPLLIERRESWWGSTPIVTWVVTVALSAPLSGALELRPSAGASIHVQGNAAPAAASQTRSLSPLAGAAAPATRAATGHSAQAEALSALLDQQPDGGRAILQALQPSADPDELRARVRAETGLDPTRAVWPLKTTVEVDAKALAAFNAAYGLEVTPEMAADIQFQTKEDWAKYAFTPGAIEFVAGNDVNAPAWTQLATPATALTQDVRPGEFANDAIEVALFSDNGNGRHAARAIAGQVVSSGLPYAFHLGDVYYGGSEQEFDLYFQKPLQGMFERTELFAITGNHEMYAKGEYFQQFLRRKAEAYPSRQRQREEMFRLCGPGFQIIGVDTMFVGWNARRLRFHDRADEAVLGVLDSWLGERPQDLTILLTTNQPWDLGSRDMTKLYASLRHSIAGRVDLWFWGNVHYAALYEPWTFPDTGGPTRSLIGSCIGHGGYPFYTCKDGAALPAHLDCRWLEKKSRFWPEPHVRPDVGANGWCKLALSRGADAWRVKLTFLDWVGRERLRASMQRKDKASLLFERVEESELDAVGGTPVWLPVPR